MRLIKFVKCIESELQKIKTLHLSCHFKHLFNLILVFRNFPAASQGTLTEILVSTHTFSREWNGAKVVSGRFVLQQISTQDYVPKRKKNDWDGNDG